MKKFEKYIKIINDCYEKDGRKQIFSSISEEELKTNLDLIDDGIDCVTTVLCSYGFNESDSEPNKYGLELDETIRYLLSLRYRIVD